MEKLKMSRTDVEKKAQGRVSVVERILSVAYVRRGTKGGEVVAVGQMRRCRQRDAVRRDARLRLRL